MSKVNGFLALLGALFIVFKITGIIAWGWIAVLAPILFGIILISTKYALLCAIAIGVVLEKKGMIDIEALKK